MRHDLTAMEAKDYVETTRHEIKAGRDALLAFPRAKGRRHAEPQGNYVFFDPGMPAADLRPAMQAAGVLVGRPFPPYLDWCRITIGTPDEMAVAHAAMRTILG